MKKIIPLIGVAALLATVLIPSMARAQATPSYGPINIIATSPSTIATTVTTNLPSGNVIDCRKQRNVGLMLMFNQSSASTSNVVYTLYRSIDGTIYDTNNALTFTIASQGTTRVNYSTNFDSLGYGYYEIYSIANATALTTMTNFGVQYPNKIGAN
jgi:hypothetical protein